MTDRLDDLERRVAALEAQAAAPAAPGTSSDDAGGPGGGVLWALDRLRDLAGEGGGVLVTGTVPLPTGGRAEWQEGVPAAGLLDDDWEPTADALAALGSPVRLRLLQAVLTGTATTAGALTDLPGVGTTGQTNHHLRRLVAAGWLSPATGAARGAYAVPLPRVVPLLAVLAMCRR